MRISQTLNKLRSAPSIFRYTRLTFAQYGEDLLLSHLRPQKRGFYVDVGAYQPRSKSNTYKLYLSGWSGITVEPNPDVARTFKKARPRDTHLTIGVSNLASELTYHKFAEPNTNSFDPQWPERTRFEVLERVPIKCVTLTDVLEHRCPNRRIDLLSVDCEGYDMQVLQSLDWRRYRPTVVIIEDFDHFRSGAYPPAPTPIRSFMLDRDYALASQAVFSCFYVDRLAFGASGRNEGFRLDQSQLGGLALP